MEKKQLILNGKVLSYFDGLINRNEEVFVFLHGWMQDASSFSTVVRELEDKNIPFISVDLPGFGNSELIHSNMTIEDYGDCIKTLIEKLGLIRPILVGHSFGGRISIYLGSSYQNIKSIVLIGSAGIAPKMHPVKLTIIKVGKVVLSLPGLRKLGESIKALVSGDDYKNAGKMTHIFKNAISNDLQKYMVNITIPTLLIWGKSDDQATLQEGEIIKSKIPGSIMQVLDGGHFIHLEKPKTIAEMILRFTHK